MSNKEQKNSKALINRKRTLSRLMAIQSFYQFEFYDEQHPIEEIKDTLIDNYLLEQEDPIKSFRKKIDPNLLGALLSGIQMNLAQLDHEISGLLRDNWDLDTLPDVMLYILRFGSFELKYMSDVPLKVVIDEYVDIGASFFEPKKVTFLNGALENLAKNYRPKEFKEVVKHPEKSEVELKPIAIEEEPKGIDPKIMLAISNLKKSILSPKKKLEKEAEEKAEEKEVVENKTPVKKKTTTKKVAVKKETKIKDDEKEVAEKVVTEKKAPVKKKTTAKKVTVKKETKIEDDEKEVAEKIITEKKTPVKTKVAKKKTATKEEAVKKAPVKKAPVKKAPVKKSAVKKEAVKKKTSETKPIKKKSIKKDA